MWAVWWKFQCTFSAPLHGCSTGVFVSLMDNVILFYFIFFLSLQLMKEIKIPKHLWPFWMLFNFVWSMYFSLTPLVLHWCILYTSKVVKTLCYYYSRHMIWGYASCVDNEFIIMKENMLFKAVQSHPDLKMFCYWISMQSG